MGKSDTCNSKNRQCIDHRTKQTKNKPFPTKYYTDDNTFSYATHTEYPVRNEVIFGVFLFVCLFVCLVFLCLFVCSFFLSVFYLSFNVDDEGKLGFMIYDKRDLFDLVNHTFLRTSISASSTHGESLSLRSVIVQYVCIGKNYGRDICLSNFLT